MKKAITYLTIVFDYVDIQILACCCGHMRYPMTIVLKLGSDNTIFELFSGEVILRKKRFYKKDKQGYYYIPEVLKKWHK